MSEEANCIINPFKMIIDAALIATASSLSLPWIPLFVEGFSHYIVPLDHLHLTLVNHLIPHLSAHPIKHPLWLSVSGGGQGSTVQGASPHKCD